MVKGLLETNTKRKSQKEKEKGIREEKVMKGIFSKVGLLTALLSLAVAGSAFAYGEGYAGGKDRDGKNYQSNATGKTTVGKTGIADASPELIKNVAGQNTHTDFKSNTNSCASCHMTHTANSANLLFGNSTQETCIACHDGSLGFYNVKTGELFSKGSTSVIIDPAFTGEIDTNTVVGSNAGSFDSSKQDSSMHNVEAGKTLGHRAAPGGNYYGVTGELGKWGDAFTCASCHAPHGSYSDRLLHYNPNGFASVDIKDRGFGLTKLWNQTGTSEEALGYKVEDVTTASFLKSDVNTNPTYRVVKGTKSQLAAKVGNTAHLPDAGTIITVVTWDSTANSYAGGYIVDKTPWVYSPGNSYPYNSQNDLFITSGATDTNGDGVINKADDWNDYTKYDQSQWTTTVINKYTYKTVHFEYGKGYALAENNEFNNVTSARISRASVVDLDLVKVASFDAKKLDLYVTNNAALVGGALDTNGTVLATNASAKSTGLGQQFSKFCATCHVDYLARSTDPATYQAYATGHYNNFDKNNCSDCHTGDVASNTVENASTGQKKFRHTTTSDSFSCARCHLTHGTNATLMKDAEGNSYADIMGAVNPDTGANFTSEEALRYLDDVNASSAIKRYTNMSVCWGCHTDNAAESLVNNTWYQANHFEPVGVTGNETWTDGNRVGFGNFFNEFTNKFTGATAYTKFPLGTSGVTSTNATLGFDKLTNKYSVTAEAGQKFSVAAITFNVESFGQVKNADKVFIDVKDASNNKVGTLSFDLYLRKAVVKLTTPVALDGDATGDEKVYNVTFNGVQYTIDMK